MVRALSQRLIGNPASSAVLVRGAIVAINFAVVAGLAAWLGLSFFGELMVVWAMAMVSATIIGLGAPLILLRDLSSGAGLTMLAVLSYVFVYPAIFAVIGAMALAAIWPEIPWGIVLLVGYLCHAATCLASIMRAFGSMQWSMILRDTGPVLALGLGAVLGVGQIEAVLGAAAVVLVGMVVIAMLWCLRHERWFACIRPAGRGAILPLSMWSTSVLGMGAAQVDIILGGLLLSSGDIGLYVLLRRITNLIALPVSVATWVSAVPIAAAFGAADRAGLRAASRQASLVALLPGLALLAICIVALSLFQAVAQDFLGPAALLAAIVLGLGAAVQVGLAASYTVATLCHLAHVAAIGRLASIVVYLVIAVIAPMNLATHAGAYVLGISLGSALVWVLVRHRLGIDTSAVALWAKQEGRQWTLS
ncbi:hypothetical protein [Yoonia sp. SS1-5]|uniref:O-antigen/teichoic acid export membrane protein n=1 Tax=Yoonia rhodophyticola TaxID=3137370 RepID=A0AAN0M8S2_9RHOB